LPVAALFGLVRSSGVVGIDEKYVLVPKNDKPAGKMRRWMYVYLAVDVWTYRTPNPESATTALSNSPATTSVTCPWPPSAPASVSSGPCKPARSLMSPTRDDHRTGNRPEGIRCDIPRPPSRVT